MKILFTVIGLYLGAVLDGFDGAAFGGVIGLLAAILLHSHQRLLELEHRMERLLPGPEAGDESADAPVADEPVSAEMPAVDSSGDDTTAAPSPEPSPPEPTSPEPAPQPVAAAPSEPTPFDRLVAAVREFFTSGNVVVKVGVIVLFFGVAFLLKYAADHNALPIELRIAGVAVAGIFLLLFGWRVREHKPVYGLVLQGGAVGILYLTVFYAARVEVVPLGLAFALMLGLVIFSCFLAVIQDSRSLAAFAVAGGFLAPVLTSTGEGNHVALFSYYTLLNAGILGIAWYRAWRVLNLIGFVFTFVIGSLWGIRYYQPEYFASTEPFLILFFLFYLGLAVLFAHRQPPRLKGLVDGSLVFGTPLVGFTLQAALMEDYEFGLALSALAVATVYVLAAGLLWRSRAPGMRMLTESFLALGVIFASLAIPFALDGRWTAAAWALEGSGMIWIGIRQQRLLPRLFGLLLHVGGALAFFAATGSPRGPLPVFNAAYIGCLMISLGGLFSSYLYYFHRDRVKAEERDLHVLWLAWGLAWWLGAGLLEIDYHVTAVYELNASLLFIAASLFLLAVLGRRLRWHTARHPAVLLLPAMAVLALLGFDGGRYRHPFGHYGYLAWIPAFVMQYRLLYRGTDVWKTRLTGYWHTGTLWLLVFVLAWQFDYLVNHTLAGLAAWDRLAWCLVPAVAVFALVQGRRYIGWPVRDWPASYLGQGVLPVIAVIALMVVVLCFQAGDPAPLPYLPVINPQDIVQVFALLVIHDWLRLQQKGELPALSRPSPGSLQVMLAGIAFLWLNALVAHGVHFYAGVRYAAEPMFESALFQTSISIVWTLTAFTIMGLSSRLGRRTSWMTGAALLAAVVAKLFLIDLADSGTVTRIVSFISVGGLMLLIGYISPVPPKQQQEVQA